MKALLLPILFLAFFSMESFADNVRLLPSNQEALQVRLDLINQAQHEILAEYYSFANDDESVRGLALLLKAAQRGVQVRIIMDAIANTVPPDLFAALLSHGKDAQGIQRLEIKVYNHFNLFKVFKLGHRDHAKLLIIDGKQFITGGRNWDKRYFRLASKNVFKDMDILIQGDSTVQAQDSFDKVWQSKVVSLPNYFQFSAERLSPDFCDHSDQETPEQCYWDQKNAIKLYRDQVARIQKFQVEEPLLAPKNGEIAGGEEVNQIIFLSHREDKLVSPSTADMTVQMLQLFHTATRELNIVSPYLVLTEGMKDAFRELLDRNVKIRIITNSIVSDDSLLAYVGYRAMKKELIELGIELYEYKGPETSHAKVAVIDGKTSIVGSFNLNSRSAGINREVGVAITEAEDGEFAKTLTLAIEELRMNSILVGKEGQPQNLNLQKQEEKKVNVGKRLYLKILRLFLPLYRKQI